jgi:hypothetical protein
VCAYRKDEYREDEREALGAAQMSWHVGFPQVG